MIKNFRLRRIFVTNSVGNTPKISRLRRIFIANSLILRGEYNQNFSPAAQNFPLFKRDGYWNAAVIFGKCSGYFFKIVSSKKKKATVIYRQK